jgi:hypothetical protein
MYIFTCSHQCSLVPDFKKLFVPVLPPFISFGAETSNLVLRPGLNISKHNWFQSFSQNKKKKVWFKTMSITLHITKQFFLSNSAQLKVEIE